MYGIVTEPVLAQDAYPSNADFVSEVITSPKVHEPDYPPIYLRHVGDRALNLYWDDPTLNDIVEVEALTWAQGQRVLETDVPNRWTVLVMQSHFHLAHPVHLHGKPAKLAFPICINLTLRLGHDFWVLAQGLGEFDLNTVPLNTKNPTRRDTVTLPSTAHELGYAVIAWPADS